MVKGGTTIYGTVVRTKYCMVILAEYPDTSISLPSMRVSRELRIRIGKVVGLDGDAEWNDSMKMVTFRVDQVTNYEGASAAEGFARLRELIGPAWDKIDDPRAYLYGDD